METKKIQTGKPNKRTNTLSLIGLIFTTIATLLLLIGFFGSIVKTRVNPSGYIPTATLDPLSYFFKDGWIDVIQQDFLGFKNLQAITQMGFILHFISYICVVVGVLIACVKVGEGWFNFSKKQRADGKLLQGSKFLVLFSISYIILTSMMMYASSEQTIADPESGLLITVKALRSYGWGTILVIIGIAFGLVSMSLCTCCGNEKLNARNIILDRIPAPLVLFIIIFGFGALAGMEYYGARSYGSFISWAGTFSNDGVSDVTIWVLYWFSFVIIVAISVLLTLSLANNKVVPKASMYCVALVLSIVAGILMQQAVAKAMDNIGGTEKPRAMFGSAFIIQIILFAGCAGVSIANAVIQKPKHATN